MNNPIDPRTVLSYSQHTEKTAQEKQQKTLASLRKSCQQFESVYLEEMFKAMRKSVPDSGVIKKGVATETYQEMLDTEMAKKASTGKGLGIGEAMYQQLHKQLKTSGKIK